MSVGCRGSCSFLYIRVCVYRLTDGGVDGERKLFLLEVCGGEAGLGVRDTRPSNYGNIWNRLVAALHTVSLSSLPTPLPYLPPSLVPPLLLLEHVLQARLQAPDC